MIGNTRDETYRATMPAHTPENEITTLIVTRQGRGRDARTWLTLGGSTTRTTVVLTDYQAGELSHLLAEASPR